MPIVAQSPAPGLFGYEVGSPTNKLKSQLAQMTAALRAQSGPSIPVAAPTAPLIGETEIGTNLRWIKAIQAAMVGASIAFTPPTFAAGENDNQEKLAAKWAQALWNGLRTAGYIA